MCEQRSVIGSCRTVLPDRFVHGECFSVIVDNRNKFPEISTTEQSGDLAAFRSTLRQRIKQDIGRVQNVTLRSIPFAGLGEGEAAFADDLELCSLFSLVKLKPKGFKDTCGHSSDSI